MYNDEATLAAVWVINLVIRLRPFLSALNRMLFTCKVTWTLKWKMFPPLQTLKNAAMDSH